VQNPRRQQIGFRLVHQHGEFQELLSRLIGKRARLRNCGGSVNSAFWKGK
jgi:hypothetical protein